MQVKKFLKKLELKVSVAWAGKGMACKEPITFFARKNVDLIYIMDIELLYVSDAIHYG